MDEKNSKEINFIEFLMSKSNRNCVRCDDCKTESKEAHLICYQISIKNNNIWWQSKYTVGCTHIESHGLPWCDNCFTIYDNGIHCPSCANIQWGTPDLNDTTRQWIWVDGSTSSVSELFVKGDKDWNIVPKKNH